MRARLIFLLAFTILGCTAHAPSRDALATTYVDLLLLSEQYKHSDTSFTAEAYRQKFNEILSNGQLTQEEFRAAVETALGSLEDSAQFYDLVIKKVNQSRTRNLQTAGHL
jgi:hypothetical protein